MAQGSAVGPDPGYAINGVLNDRLDTLEKQLQACCEEHLALGQVATAATLCILVQLLPAEAPAAEAWRSFQDYFTEWTTPTRAKGRVRTAQAAETTVRYLLRYEQTARYAVDYDTLTPAFDDAFVLFLLGSGALPIIPSLST